MKKSLLWIVVLILSISMVAAFSEVAAAEKAPLPSGKLVIWGWSPNELWLDASLDGFKEEYPDIKWEWVPYSTGDVYVNLPLALTAGKGAPDICLVENSHLESIVEMGGLLDITEKIQPYIDNLATYKLKECRKDDKYYAVPWDGSPVAMYYRRDVFEKAGLPTDPESVEELVSTWDKYYEVAKTIKEKTGLYMQACTKANNNGRLLEMLLWERGLGYIDDKGKVSINSPEAVETLEFIGKMTSEGLYSDEVDWTDGWYAEFKSLDQSVASYIEASWMGGFFKSWVAPETTGLWGIVHIPAYKEGGVRASADGGSSFVITEQCQNPEAAWALIEYALLRDQSVINCFIAGDYTPSLVTSYDSDVFKVKDPFYAGQVIGTMFNDIMLNIPEVNIYTTEYAEMSGLTSPEVAKYLTGKQSAQEALDNAAAAIRAATGRQ